MKKNSLEVSRIKAVISGILPNICNALCFGGLFDGIYEILAAYSAVIVIMTLLLIYDNTETCSLKINISWKSYIISGIIGYPIGYGCVYLMMNPSYPVENSVYDLSFVLFAIALIPFSFVSAALSYLLSFFISRSSDISQKLSLFPRFWLQKRAGSGAEPQSYRIFFILISCVLLIAEIVIGVFYGGWVRAYLGDVLVIPLIYSLIRSVSPDKPRYGIILPTIVLCTGFTAELLQLIGIADILGIYDELLRIIIGTSFSLIDLLCYIIGAVPLYIFEHYIAKKSPSRS